MSSRADLEQLETAFLEGVEVAGTPSTISGRVRSLLPVGIRDPLRMTATGWIGPLSRRKLAAAAKEGHLRLHLASGFNPKPDWLNLDLLGAPTDVSWNLAKGIPLPDDSVEAVFHEHFQEHLTPLHGYLLTQECLRVLMPGGTLRVGVPDAGACLRSYAGTGDPDWAASAATPMLAVTALFYENGHRAMYDGETLCGLMSAIGFVDVRECEFGSSRIDPCPDSEIRRAGTLYVEGVKPAVESTVAA